MWVGWVIQRGRHSEAAHEKDSFVPKNVPAVGWGGLCTVGGSCRVGGRVVGEGGGVGHVGDGVGHVGLGWMGHVGWVWVM